MPAKPASRVALYGGAFDPVHNAHLEVARCACRALLLDRIIFIPASQSPLKLQGPQAPDAERLEMLHLATAGEARFSVDDYELRRGGISYTIDTVKHFRGLLDGAELFWVLGADQFEQLDRWRSVQALSSMVTYLVLARPGYSPEAPPVAGLRFTRVDAPLMEESSTMVREKCRNSESIKGLVPEAVRSFITEKALYASAE
ncbi:nicotinate-nucleotide adenylyltransferase [Coraliomargarita parva]|uniref:nicotinate-nucleotide adenylyltransferase n=1 Tax=Coraliomargarita parva TaxID=3014050 RepID=UPI0022B41DC3|nr:nicotinate-nucleotide adenylyltransferase [Coraliomargarita parva]